MVIAITGGGTGGHLSIAKAFGQECKKMGIHTLYIGGTTGQDKQWFENDTQTFDDIIFLESTPVVNKKFIKKFSAFFQNIKESFKARKKMKALGVQACISVGGFSAATGGFGAIFGGIPLFIHEQNACMGSLNMLLKPLAKAFFSGFEFRNAHIMPYPTNEIFFEKQRIRKKLRYILFLGGSQGAKAINEFALKIAPILRENNIIILHQTGRLDYENTTMQYKNMGFEITEKLEDITIQQNLHSESCLDKDSYKILVFAFSKDMPNIMQTADFCISRSGASSLWEGASNGLPTLFIPYPFATKNHQYFNAKILSDKDYALLYTQKEIEEYQPLPSHRYSRYNIPKDTTQQDLEYNNIYMSNDNQKRESDDILERIFTLNLTQISQELIQYTQKNGAKMILDKIITICEKK
ncbi:UDP-N-acetylglucosamine--N-acetylmuramyl-(pentapeptide) pyrophosphoryl-undecaprenol N-acetylglucosamine transferase [Helicobacter didelphidarum]|uniref:UDP-N-acetylglucosamine--N-acetylmuramyl-(pentapeptide) pyrophosphoryl-undecaprenol N-acetylglucosamine transferase n=1 Tax=Helicobacter didelphidarum TaxID=2040648 RepID=A0A3D8IP54_9HELI|nr:glycosyltransferase [Helicobacter didelphidarum]RDU67002.1 UDP-N-acetylglucosamine--N-acetylmuramyl-(pentapeptide) pyrophosphoryl-undecaprenol N-acetylglucosamine transferase [Helicobacter didelphidarum]